MEPYLSTPSSDHHHLLHDCCCPGLLNAPPSYPPISRSVLYPERSSQNANLITSVFCFNAAFWLPWPQKSLLHLCGRPSLTDHPFPHPSSRPHSSPEPRLCLEHPSLFLPHELSAEGFGRLLCWSCFPALALPLFSATSFLHCSSQSRSLSLGEAAPSALGAPMATIAHPPECATSTCIPCLLAWCLHWPGRVSLVLPHTAA